MLVADIDFFFVAVLVRLAFVFFAMARRAMAEERLLEVGAGNYVFRTKYSRRVGRRTAGRLSVLEVRLLPPCYHSVIKCRRLCCGNSCIVHYLLLLLPLLFAVPRRPAMQLTAMVRVVRSTLIAAVVVVAAFGVVVCAESSFLEA